MSNIFFYKNFFLNYKKKKTINNLDNHMSTVIFNCGLKGAHYSNIQSSKFFNLLDKDKDYIKMDLSMKSLFLKLTSSNVGLVFISFKPDSYIKIACLFFSIVDISKKG